jgi:nucleotide-binding universal stress UspA family protein
MAHRLFPKILVAHDGSDPADRAFAKALALASLSKAELHVISVG